jgi:hypothetical protein
MWRCGDSRDGLRNTHGAAHAREHVGDRPRHDQGHLLQGARGSEGAAGWPAELDHDHLRGLSRLSMQCKPNSRRPRAPPRSSHPVTRCSRPRWPCWRPPWVTSRWTSVRAPISRPTARISARRWQRPPPVSSCRDRYLSVTFRCCWSSPLPPVTVTRLSEGPEVEPDGCSSLPQNPYEIRGFWRRERDSNPRGLGGPCGFQVWVRGVRERPYAFVCIRIARGSVRR